MGELKGRRRFTGVVGSLPKFQVRPGCRPSEALRLQVRAPKPHICEARQSPELWHHFCTDLTCKLTTMKTTSLITSALAALALTALPAKAQFTYTGTGDANGAVSTGAGFNSAVVQNDASTITFTLNTTGTEDSYIFYTIEIQQLGLGGSGSTSLVNPWGESIGISTGVNALINTWNTGASELTYSGGTWTQNDSESYVAGGTGSSFVKITAPLSSLGLSAGNSFYFDVVSSYANPTAQSAYGALDSLGYPAESDNQYTPWNGTSYYDSATDAVGTTFGTAASEYTVVVPEPTSLALLGLGGLVVILRRKVSVR